MNRLSFIVPLVFAIFVTPNAFGCFTMDQARDPSESDAALVARFPALETFGNGKDFTNQRVAILGIEIPPGISGGSLHLDEERVRPDLIAGFVGVQGIVVRQTKTTIELRTVDDKTITFLLEPDPYEVKGFQRIYVQPLTPGRRITVFHLLAHIPRHSIRPDFRNLDRISLRQQSFLVGADVAVYEFEFPDYGSGSFRIDVQRIQQGLQDGTMGFQGTVERVEGGVMTIRLSDGTSRKIGPDPMKSTYLLVRKS